MHNKSRIRGFSLIEIVVTMAIVALLASMAIASYSRYVRQTNRSDATKTMMSYAQTLQRCYSQYFTYNPALPAVCTVTAGNTTSVDGYYTINVAIPNATTYTITATPLKAPQTNDTSCVSFTLQSTGQQGALDAGNNNTTQTCWGSLN